MKIYYIVIAYTIYMSNNRTINLNISDTRTVVALRNLINNDEFECAFNSFEEAAENDPVAGRKFPKENLINVIAASATENLPNCLSFLAQLKEYDPDNTKWDLPNLDILFENIIFRDTSIHPITAYQFLKEYKNEAFTKKWFRSLDKLQFQKLITQLSVLPAAELYSALKPYLDDIMSTDNIGILLVIKDELPELYEDVLASLAKNDNKTSNRIFYILSHIDKLDEIPDPAFRESACENMLAILNGFGYLDGNHVCLIAAAMTDKNEKPPTVIEWGRINEYMDLLANASKPLCERFIHAGIQHYLSAQVNVNAKGEAQLLIIEPLGYEKHESAELNLFISSKQDIIHAFHRSFPKSRIYISSEVRQRMMSCTVFALDDTHNLYKLPSYYKSKDNNLLFDLLKNRIEMTVAIDKIPVYVASLPTQFLRTMSSQELLKILTKPENKYAPLSRTKPVTGESYSKNATGFFTREFKLKTTLQNTRLQRKLIKMSEITLKFLLSHPLEEINKRMNECTMEGLIERLQAEKDGLVDHHKRRK